MKKIDELKQQLNALKAEARSLNAEAKVEEAGAKLEEVRALNKQIEIQEELDKEEVREVKEKLETRKEEIKETELENRNIEERNAFIKALQGKQLNDAEKRAMSGLQSADGGVLIPADIRTKINQYKRELQSAKNLVRVENVVTRTGSRVYEKLADMTPLANLTELGSIADAGNPQFETVSYTIADYAGMLKLSNSLLQDTPENVMEYIAKWFARKSVVTENARIFGLLNTTYSTKGAIAAGKEIADLKKILNVALDPAISSGAKIVTNQDGFQSFDALVDGEGRPLLKPDVTDSSVYRLNGKEVVVFSNKQLPSVGTTTKKAPVIVGDFQEAVTFFDRQEMELKATDIGGNAFETNTTNVRVIERFDVKSFDKDALVYAEIAVS